MIKLRDYQRVAVGNVCQALRDNSRTALVEAATGSGKSMIMASLISSILERSPKFRACVIVPRVQLITQLNESLIKFGINAGLYCGSLNKREIAPITLATYHSLYAADQLPTFDMIVLDECHRLETTKDSKGGQLIKALSHTGTRLVGFTATPFRNSKPLWANTGSLWNEPVFSAGVGYLTKRGYLVPARLVGGRHSHSTKNMRVERGDWAAEDLAKIAADTSKLRAQVKDALGWLDQYRCKRVIWICIDKAHARATREALLSASKDHADTITSDNTQNERGVMLEGFSGDGRTRHMVSVGILKEGYDNPEVDSLVFLRPTRSVVDYMQAVGRTLRLHPGKRRAVILDYGDVVRNCGPIDRPFIDMTGQMGAASKKGRDAIVQSMDYSVEHCARCGVFFFPLKKETKTCTECGHDNEDARTKNLRKKAATGELYAEKLVDHPWGRFAVLGLTRVVPSDFGAEITFKVCSAIEHVDSATGEVNVVLYAPSMFSGSQRDIRLMRHTKVWCTKAFGMEPTMTAREMVRCVLEERIKQMPRELWQTDTGIGFIAQGAQAVRREVAQTAAMQETLL